MSSKICLKILLNTFVLLLLYSHILHFFITISSFLKVNSAKHRIFLFILLFQSEDKEITFYKSLIIFGKLEFSFENR